jgi:hypothetical protein
MDDHEPCDHFKDCPRMSGSCDNCGLPSTQHACCSAFTLDRNHIKETNCLICGLEAKLHKVKPLSYSLAVGMIPWSWCLSSCSCSISRCDAPVSMLLARLDCAQTASFRESCTPIQSLSSPGPVGLALMKRFGPPHLDTFTSSSSHALHFVASHEAHSVLFPSQANEIQEETDFTETASVGHKNEHDSFAPPRSCARARLVRFDVFKHFR